MGSSSVECGMEQFPSPNDFKLLNSRKGEYPETGIVFTRYTAKCPFPSGSRHWFAVADHVQGQIATAQAEKPRRILFGRDNSEGLFDKLSENEAFASCIKKSHQKALVEGFDGIDPKTCTWQVVCVEYLCQDGKVERIFTGIPTNWDPQLSLGVMILQTVN